MAEGTRRSVWPRCFSPLRDFYHPQTLILNVKMLHAGRNKAEKSERSCGRTRIAALAWKEAVFPARRCFPGCFWKPCSQLVRLQSPASKGEGSQSDHFRGSSLIRRERTD